MSISRGKTVLLASAMAALALPALAQTSAQPPGSTPPVATGAATQGAAGMTAPEAGKAGTQVERRLAMLHKRLQITADEEQKWSAFAAVMRENAQHMDSVFAESQAHDENLNAVDRLNAYEHVTEAHMQDLQRLIPAFDTLYASFTPAQKANADAVFRQRAERHAEHGKAARRGAAPDKDEGG